jgi:hypothetical protein
LKISGLKICSTFIALAESQEYDSNKKYLLKSFLLSAIVKNKKTYEKKIHSFFESCSSTLVLCNVQPVFIQIPKRACTQYLYQCFGYHPLWFG